MQWQQDKTAVNLFSSEKLDQNGEPAMVWRLRFLCSFVFLLEEEKAKALLPAPRRFRPLCLSASRWLWPPNSRTLPRPFRAQGQALWRRPDVSPRSIKDPAGRAVSSGSRRQGAGELNRAWRKGEGDLDNAPPRAAPPSSGLATVRPRGLSSTVWLLEGSSRSQGVGGLRGGQAPHPPVRRSAPLRRTGLAGPGERVRHRQSSRCGIGTPALPGLSALSPNQPNGKNEHRRSL